MMAIKKRYTNDEGTKIWIEEDDVWIKMQNMRTVTIVPTDDMVDFLRDNGYDVKPKEA